MTPKIPFDPPPRNLELVNGDTHVFYAALDPPLSRLVRFAEILSADERARAGRYRFERDRNRFLAGRGTLREILGWLLHVEPACLVFACGDRGKPRLAAPVGGRLLYFNLAHSDALAVYAVSAQYEVGIDVERIRPIGEAEAIATRFFSARENAEWRSVPAERRTEAFFSLWTYKEALLKAAGVGLGGPFNQMDFLLPPSQPAPVPPSAKAQSAISRYFLYSLVPADGYTGAAATKAHDAPFCWKWS